MKFRRRSCALACALLLAVAQPTVHAATDTRPLSLQHLSTADGLPQATVMTTLQDSQGFVWIATEDGLVRYDGHDLVRYGYERGNPTSLPGNFVRDVVEDRAGNVWVAVKDAGIARWDRSTDRFTVYRHDPAKPRSLGSNAARALVVDPQGRLWVATTDAGISVLDPATNSFEHLRHDPEKPGSLVDDRVHVLALDRAGNVWVGTDAGLARWQPESRTFVHVGHASGDAALLGRRRVSEFLEDSAGRLWVGTFDAGLFQIDWQGRVLRAFRHDSQRPDSLAHDDVRALLEDEAGRLWVGTADGLSLFDRATGGFAHYRNDRADPGSLPDSFVMSLYQDSSGLVWIGTRTAGVSRWDPHSWELGGHRPEWLNGRMVTSFADAPNRRLWVGSLGGGLVRFDPDTGDALDVDAILRRRGVLRDQRVMSLRTDRRGVLWIGTMTDGLKSLDKEGRLESIPVKRGDPRALSAPGIMTIYEARNGLLWIGTHGGGANVLDPATGDVRQLPFGTGPGAVSGANVSAFAEDASGNVWIATAGAGLNVARPDGSVLKSFRHDPRDPTSLSSDAVYALAADREGRIWIGTDDGGLDLVVGSSAQPDAIHFDNFSRSEGLSSDTIYGIVPDASGNLWLSGNAGLMRLDPRTRAIKTFHREHGLQGEEFNFNAYHQLRDGRIAFGGNGGFNVFDAARLSDSGRPPRVVVTRIEVMGAPLATGAPSWLTGRLELGHDANLVALDFAALDFQSPHRNRLAYRVQGLTDRWIDLGTQHRVTLTNLEAGEHVLEVRAANADSVWSEKPLAITITKAASPWRTPVAYACYALLVGGFVAYRVWLQRRRLARAFRRQQTLEADVAKRTQELVESNRLLAEAARAKEGFLARMSHELRTPMNGVVGMTELLARTSLTPTQEQLTGTIRSSAESLLRILNDLLDLSKINAGKVELETLSIDLTQLLEECAALFAGACDRKGLELVVSPPDRQDLAVLGDPLRIRQVLMNLIGNAVKFTEQGEIVVKADIVVDAPGRADVRLTVSDTGIGMEPQVAARVFEPFAQADESTSRRFGGTGLGLAICRELAQLMGGTIRVDSRASVGSTFVVSLPLAVEPAALRAIPPLLNGRYARIQTRRPALRESLERYLAALGVTALAASTGPVDAAPEGTLLLVDADSHGPDAQSLVRRGAAACGAVVLATPAAVRSWGLEQPGAERRCRILPKPVKLDALRESLEHALGAPAATAPEALVHSTATRGHVLIVEDDPVNATVAEGYLGVLGCTSVWVADGPTALSRSAGEHFDLILMDINMPSLDGYQTASLIRLRERDGRRTPIVALTAHGAGEARARCLAAGIDDVLGKPYTLAECAELVRRWIGETPVLGPQLAANAPAAAAAPPAPELHGDDPQAAVARLALVDDGVIAGLGALAAGRQADLYPRLVALFERSSTQSLGELASAIEGGRWPDAAAVCHKLKSSAANVGAVAFAGRVRELEQACHAGLAERAGALHAQLAAAHPALLEALRNQPWRATA